ncbi:MAG: thioredoxin fold domain-containing protein [Planctomycetota bacterium]
MNLPTRRGGITLSIIIVLILLVGLMVTFFVVRSGAIHGGNPEASDNFFQTAGTFSDAQTTAATEGKLVFVLATADWCPPCRSFRGGTLADPAVQDQIASVAIPYKLDVTNQNLPAHDAELAQMLNVSSIPAVYAVDGDNNVVASAVGNLSDRQLTSWLSNAASQQ